ncbi:MAG: hypothetical protein US85_C0025G0012 [Candidatus Shapirobacteria bacterium GW2011_GWF1_38_23]|nr:MAG: hypothetical protein US85_C0025G0012 [Candidatus Shapirobacteria bacterium GW2011_GWF1_38_23]
MSVLGILAIIFLLSFLVEAMVEYIFGKLFDHVPVLVPYKWLLQYVALGFGVLGAFIYKFDVITITGLAIGRGSNFIHDLIKKFFQQDPLVTNNTVYNTVTK